MKTFLYCRYATSFASSIKNGNSYKTMSQNTEQCQLVHLYRLSSIFLAALSHYILILISLEQWTFTHLSRTSPFYNGVDTAAVFHMPLAIFSFFRKNKLPQARQQRYYMYIAVRHSSWSRSFIPQASGGSRKSHKMI